MNHHTDPWDPTTAPEASGRFLKRSRKPCCQSGLEGVAVVGPFSFTKPGRLRRETAEGRSGFLLSGARWAARPHKNVALVDVEPGVRFLPGDRSPLLVALPRRFPGRAEASGGPGSPAHLGEPRGPQKDEPSGADQVRFRPGNVVK